jgi:hypothetical protein
VQAAGCGENICGGGGGEDDRLRLRLDCHRAGNKLLPYFRGIFWDFYSTVSNFKKDFKKIVGLGTDTHCYPFRVSYS